MENATEIRQRLLAGCHQIVIKAGTRLLTDRSRIARLVDGIAEVRRRGCRVLLVSSGAVGMGMQQLGLSRRPRDLAAVQALASVGQCKLMALYEEECARHGFKVAQLLLTAADLRSRNRYLNVMNCINALWENDVLPVVNENDAVSVDELKFGDNDYLAGLLASLTGSRLTVILTTAEGLCRRENGVLGDRISVVPRIDASIRAMAGGTDSSEFSIGGMTSKLRSAELVNASGEYLWIADGRGPDILRQIMDGEDVGTVFLPGPERISGHKRFIRFFAGSSGTLTVDAGAAAALISRGGSLLPSGVTGVSGSFSRGDTVDIVAPDGKLIARGLVNYTAADCLRIKGLHSAELEAELGHTADAEIVHRDNLTLL
ncbi:MAG: glutamate 5-kinase [Lentisphaeria bacterium]|nr:glutamate 5-kinase [Lentisphaeria bacterium]